MGSQGKVRLMGWLTTGQLAIWAVVMVGALAVYCYVIEQCFTSSSSVGPAIGLLWMLLVAPALFVGALPSFLWWQALASWRRREVDAKLKIRAAGVLTAAIPVLLGIAPEQWTWWMPHLVYAVTALAVVGALALIAIWAAHAPEVAARLTEPPRKPERRAPIANWPAPTVDR